MANYYSNKHGKEFEVSTSLYGGTVEIVHLGEGTIWIPSDILIEIAEDFKAGKIDVWEIKGE